MTTDVQLRTQTLTRARACTRARAHEFSCKRRSSGAQRTKGADLMVVMCSQIWQSRDRLWLDVGRSSGLASLCTASSLTQAWSCRGGGKGGDSGAGCFPGPPRSLFPLELLSVPNLPESSTHPALNASFPLLAPQLLRASPFYKRKGHSQTSCRQHRKGQPLDVVVLSGVLLLENKRN